LDPPRRLLAYEEKILGNSIIFTGYYATLNVGCD